MEPLIHPHVELGEGSEIGPFAVVGEPPRGRKPGDLPTWIGPGSVIRSHTVIYAGNRIGARFQTGHHVMIREENEIGDDVRIGTQTVAEHPVRVPKPDVLEPGRRRKRKRHIRRHLPHMRRSHVAVGA